MNPKPVIFIVRIWPLAEGFKASVRAVDSEETHHFQHAEALVRYLVERVLPPADSSGPTKRR